MPTRKSQKPYLGAHGSILRRLIFITIALVLILCFFALVLAMLIFEALTATP